MIDRLVDWLDSAAASGLDGHSTTMSVSEPSIVSGRTLDDADPTKVRATTTATATMCVGMTTGIDEAAGTRRRRWRRRTAADGAVGDESRLAHLVQRARHSAQRHLSRPLALQYTSFRRFLSHSSVGVFFWLSPCCSFALSVRSFGRSCQQKTKSMSLASRRRPAAAPAPLTAAGLCRHRA
jgi:hypothetical protein